MNSFYLYWFSSLLETFYVPFWARKEIAFVKQFHKLEKKQKRIKIVCFHAVYICVRTISGTFSVFSYYCKEHCG